jgi:hypothetical protein
MTDTLSLLAFLVVAGMTLNGGLAALVIYVLASQKAGSVQFHQHVGDRVNDSFEGRNEPPGMESWRAN